MSWRTIVISSRAKLDYQMNYLVIRKDTTIRIHLSEIRTLIIESTAVSLTAYLLSELVKRKIKVVFCDEKRNPISELMAYYGSHDTSMKVRKQISWKPGICGLMWAEIVSEKIRNQRDLLKSLNKNKEVDLLDSYIREIVPGDESNREGHAAKVYFNALFGMDFTRTAENNINAALNYGYTILLSAFNREITASGYITQIGIFHDNMFNQFNLSSDLMEPFRPLVDELVYGMDLDEFDQDAKMQIVNILNTKVEVEGRVHHLNNAIKIYCHSVFDALNEEDISLIRFYKNEL